jgi:sodium-dependent dicarboxylate transporter 2/3/5
LTRASLKTLEINGVLLFAGLTDTGIAVLAGLALFVIPAGGTGPSGERLMTWQDAERLPFGTLILFGGGLALAGTVSATAADQFIGAQLAALQGIPIWLAVLAVVSAVVFLTELTSNTATTTTLVPILAAAAVALHLDPFSLIIVTALAASCAFMMPVATPPNAIIFASDRVPVAAMARAGLLINVIAIVVITAVALYWIPRVTPVGLGP